MLIQDRLGSGKVLGPDPNLGREPRNVAKAGVQIVAEYLTANALLLERLLPDVGLKRICGCGKSNNLMLIFQIHDIPLSTRSSRVTVWVLSGCKRSFEIFSRFTVSAPHSSPNTDPDQACWGTSGLVAIKRWISDILPPTNRTFTTFIS